MTKKQINMAIQELKLKLLELFGEGIKLTVFGSAARRDYRKHSDIDVLVLLPVRVNNTIEEKVFDAAYDIELKYGVIFGIVVYPKEFWASDLAASMPLYQNIQKEGVSI